MVSMRLKKTLSTPTALGTAQGATTTTFQAAETAIVARSLSTLTSIGNARVVVTITS